MVSLAVPPGPAVSGSELAGSDSSVVPSVEVSDGSVPVVSWAAVISGGIVESGVVVPAPVVWGVDV